MQVDSSPSESEGKPKEREQKLCGTVEREVTYWGKAADKIGKQGGCDIILPIRGGDVSEQGALRTAGRAVLRAGVPVGAQTMTFVGME